MSAAIALEGFGRGRGVGFRRPRVDVTVPQRTVTEPSTGVVADTQRGGSITEARGRRKVSPLTGALIAGAGIAVFAIANGGSAGHDAPPPPATYHGVDYDNCGTVLRNQGFDVVNTNPYGSPAYDSKMWTGEVIVGPQGDTEHLVFTCHPHDRNVWTYDTYVARGPKLEKEGRHLGGTLSAQQVVAELSNGHR